MQLYRHASTQAYTSVGTPSLILGTPDSLIQVSPAFFYAIFAQGKKKSLGAFQQKSSEATVSQQCISRKVGCLVACFNNPAPILNITIYSGKSLHAWMSWVRLGGMWTLSGAGGVGRPVRVAGGKLVVADVFGHHELLHDHDMHGDEVVLDGRDALGTLGSAPVLLKEENCLRLFFLW